MDFRVDGGSNSVTEQPVPVMISLARLLVKRELERLGLEKELQAVAQDVARDIIQSTVRDAVRVVLDEMAGDKVKPALLERQDGVPAALSQVPQVSMEPCESTNPAIFPPVPERQISASLPGEQLFAGGGPAGLYIYGVAMGEEEIDLDAAGIDGCRVYTLSAAGLCAVVHDCSAEPYRPDNDEHAKGWLFEHQDVLDRVKEMLGDVLPMGFNTIMHAAGRRPQEVLRDWLARESSRLKAMLGRLRDKEEYAVKILLTEEILKQAALREDSRLQELQRELNDKPEGVRYLYRERLEKSVKEALEDIVEIYFRKAYQAIRPSCADIQVEKTKRVSPEKRIIANLSCLVEKSKVTELGETLAEIERWEGFTVDFTGPWPPYSFVGELAVPA
ncbi:MAG: Gas vesicle synthesis protein GvpL/GvpF [Pelotomaculum sp. PtaU1.Bin035]|nr:MAG: Gas vesicle synthesis protein GvpL/GvpF [Pelotomaculum sp. PtaU1.Bin035]